MDIASASLLDEATAAAEAMAMAKRVSKLKNANKFFIADDIHPQTLDVVRTRAETFGFELITTTCLVCCCNRWERQATRTITAR